MQNTIEWDRWFRGLAVAVAVSLAVGCGDDGGDGDGPTGPDVSEGTFTATVSGDVDASFEGNAAWASVTDPASGESAWGIVLGDTNVGSNAVVIFHLGTSEPETGTYSLVDASVGSDFQSGTGAFVVLSVGGSSTLSVNSTGGTVTISSASADRLRGTFNITASGALIDGNMTQHVTVTVSGEFDALGSDSLGFPGL